MSPRLHSFLLAGALGLVSFTGASAQHTVDVAARTESGRSGGDTVETMVMFEEEGMRRALRYPDAARDEGIEGEVTLAITFDAVGRPVAARVLHSPNSVLDSAAIEFVITRAPIMADTAVGFATRMGSLPVRFSLDYLRNRHESSIIPPELDLRQPDAQVRVTDEMRAKKLGGRVLVDVLVDRSGVPVRAYNGGMVYGEYSELVVDAAIDAAMRMRFRPAFRPGGIPTHGWATIEIDVPVDVPPGR